MHLHWYQNLELIFFSKLIKYNFKGFPITLMQIKSWINLILSASLSIYVCDCHAIRKVYQGVSIFLSPSLLLRWIRSGDHRAGTGLSSQSFQLQPRVFQRLYLRCYPRTILPNRQRSNGPTEWSPNRLVCSCILRVWPHSAAESGATAAANGAEGGL